MLFTVGRPFGWYQLNLEVHATETFNTAVPSAIGTDPESIDDSQVQCEDQYHKDKHACEAPFIDIATRYVHYHSYLHLILTLPDPPEEFGVAVRNLKALARELEALQNAPVEVRRGVDKVLRVQLGVSSGALRGLIGRGDEGGEDNATG